MPFVPDTIDPAQKGRFVPDAASEPPPVVRPAPVTLGDRAVAVPAGVNAGVAGTVGLPVDTLLNVFDLVKAGAGYVTSKVTGEAPPSLFDPTERGKVVGSSEYIGGKLNQAGIITQAPRPEDTVSRYLYAAATGVPGALTGGAGSAPNLARQVAAGAAAGIGAQGAADLGADPGTQALTALAIGAGAGVPASRKTKPAAAPPSPQVPPTTTQTARAAGYKLKPSETEGAGLTGKAAEGLSGSARLERSLIIENQKLTNRLAAEEIGLPPDSRITSSALTKAKSPHNAVYEEVGNKLGEFETSPEYLADLQKALPARGATRRAKEDIADLIEEYSLPSVAAKDAVQMTRQLRAKSSKMIRSDDPDVETRGYAMRAVSDAIEAELERQAVKIGEPDIVTRFRDARTSLAKIHTVESARVAGDISAKNVAKLGKRAPLSGRLKIIADVAEEFPNVTRTASRIKDNVPVSVLEGAGSFGGALLTSNPAFLAGLLPRPLTRAVLASDLYQNRLGRAAGADPDLASAQQRMVDLGYSAADPLKASPVLADYFVPRASASAVNNVPPAYAPASSDVLPFAPTAATLGTLPPELALRASTLAGDLGLVPELPPGAIDLPPAPRIGELTADVPPVLRGDLPFTPSRPLGEALAGDLTLAPDVTPEGIPFTPSPAPRAAGMAEDVPGTTLYPELRAIRDRPNAPTQELTLAGRGEGERVTFKGDELGDLQSPYDLKKRAREIANQKFADRTVTNKLDGTNILIPPKGIKHGLSGYKSRASLIAMTKLDEVLQRGRHIKSGPDEEGRNDIVAVHIYETPIDIAGTPTVIRSVVRELKDGRRYYDHSESEVRLEAPVTGGAVKTVGLPSTKTGAPDAGANTTNREEHIVLRGNRIRRKNVSSEKGELP